MNALPNALPLEYQLGNIIQLRLDPPISSRDSAMNNRASQYIRVQILHAYVPFTMAVVLRVQLDPNTDQDQLCSGLSKSQEYVIKLFDHRYSEGLRKYHDCAGATYGYDKVVAHQIYLSKPTVKDMVAWHDAGHLLTNDLDGTRYDGAIEACISSRALEMWRKETEVYRHLEELQGTMIPRSFGSLEYPPSTIEYRNEGRGRNVPENLRLDTRPFAIPGIILEYIQSTTIRDYLDSLLAGCSLNSPSANWERVAFVCNEAVASSRKIGQLGVLNRDVRLDNILVPIAGKQP